MRHLKEKDEVKRKLTLPKKYGPMCLKILHEFITHHKLSKNLPLPESSSSTEEALSRIFDVMLHSMGEEKRNEVLDDVSNYSMSLPAFFTI